MKSELTASGKPLTDLDTKLRRAYEDNLSSRLPDHIFTMLIGNYDNEKENLQNTVRELEKRIDASSSARSDVVCQANLEIHQLRYHLKIDD